MVGKRRRFPTTYDIQQTRSGDLLRRSGYFLDGLRSFEERDIRTRFKRSITATHRFLETERSPRIRARYDHEIIILARIRRRANFRQVVVKRDQLLIIEMTAPFREYLILDMNAGDTGLLEGTNGTKTFSSLP